MGGGGNPVKKALKDPIGTVANVAVNYGTFGLVGYDAKSGKIKKGVLTKGVDESIGEITGRNQARKALNEQNARLDEAKAQDAQDRANQQLQDYRADLLASRSAAATRNTAAARSRGTRASTLGAEEEDILGV